MKIGILTQPLRNNYGGLLQNYALQTVLKKEGYDVVTIDWDWSSERSIRLILSATIRYILHYMTNGRISKVELRYVPTPDEDAIIHMNVYRFVRKYINATTKTQNIKPFERIANSQNCNAFIVGSDQCWRPKYNASFLPVMYLSFVTNDNIKRLSYAASFGTDKWEYSTSQTEKCKKLVKQFDLVTVREKSGINLCKEYFGIEVSQVLDPTMLLDKEDYINLIVQENEPECKGSLFYYILDPNDKTEKFIESVARNLELSPFMVLPKYKEEYRKKINVKENIKDCIYPSPLTWIRAFYDAKMTIVDSFHGMVFSIIFNKPFWVIGNKKRGMSRFLSLLEMFDLQDRLIDENDLSNVDIRKPINWDMVNKKREALKNYSLSLLLNFLRK